MHDNTEAHSRCLTETGAFLATAQDDEAAAVNELINASAGDLRGIARKVDALQDMLEIGGIWSDRRDIRMLASVQRDIRTMMRRVA